MSKWGVNVLKILVTGANGFVGRAVCSLLHRSGHYVRGAVRCRGVSLPTGVQAISVGELDADTDWTRAMQRTDVVIHLAGRTHVLRETSSNPKDAFHRQNVEGTSRLARMAAEAGVTRLIFVSSIKVNGDATYGAPFRETDRPFPHGHYAVSKYQAEQELRRISRRSSLEVVIVRPPLIYGPGVKGNLLSLLRIVDRGVPLPIGGIDNRRSLISIDNLVELIALCVDHPHAAGQVFLASDGEDMSTPELVRILAAGMERSVSLINLPPSLLRFGSALLCKQALCDRLCGSLAVDNLKARSVLGWTPSKPVKEGLMEMARWYREQKCS